MTREQHLRCDIYQEEQRVVDDELAGESQQIRAHGLKQSRDENHSQVVG